MTLHSHWRGPTQAKPLGRHAVLNLHHEFEGSTNSAIVRFGSYMNGTRVSEGYFSGFSTLDCRASSC